jgi:hypothetical protein
MLRKKSGPKREVLKGDQKKLYIEEHHNFSSSLNIMMVIKLGRIRRTERTSLMEQTRNIYILTVETTERSEQLGKPSSRWKDDIEMRLTRNAIGWEPAD